MAYVYLTPGQSFSVKIIVDTANSVYGNPGVPLSHTIEVNANTTAPSRP